MKQVFEILRDIEMRSSRNGKKDILLQNKDNELLKKYFLYAYNERWIFGIGSKSIKSYERIQKLKEESKERHQINKIIQRDLFSTNIIQKQSDNIFEILDELRKHPYGSNEDIQLINNFLGNCTEEEYYWYTKLILKNLRIGCTATTINEIYENLIPEFKVMLAHPYAKYSHKIKDKIFQLQRKINGFRLITYLYPDGKIQFFTRNGVELFDFPELEIEFKLLISMDPLQVPIVFDGELDKLDSFNDTQKIIMYQGPKLNVNYHLFDVLTLAEFESGESIDRLFSRYDVLKSLIPTEFITMKVEEELYRGSDISEVTKWFNIAKSEGWEGIMLKLNDFYVRKRTSSMLKIKEFETIDLRVLRVNPGTGKHADRLGSVTVDFEGVEVDVGSGFDDYAREKFWVEPNLIIDKIIEIQFFERTTNDKNQPSLQFPVYKGVRHDKS